MINTVFAHVLALLTEGNMDDRMAEAVEQAAVVLVCFSKKYQESANCKKGKREETDQTIVDKQ